MTEALRLATEIFPSSGVRVGVLREIGRSAILNPRVGLRRWVMRSNDHTTPGVRTDTIHIELHHDGSSVIAVGVNRWVRDTFSDFHAVPTRIVESALAEAIATAATHARTRGHTGRLLVHATLISPDQDMPFGAIDNHLGGGFYSDTMSLIHQSRAPHAITPAETEITADAEPQSLRSSARQLAEDLLHQFGLPYTSIPE